MTVLLDLLPKNHKNLSKSKRHICKIRRSEQRAVPVRSLLTPVSISSNDRSPGSWNYAAKFRISRQIVNDFPRNLWAADVKLQIFCPNFFPVDRLVWVTQTTSFHFHFVSLLVLSETRFKLVRFNTNSEHVLLWLLHNTAKQTTNKSKWTDIVKPVGTRQTKKGGLVPKIKFNKTCNKKM